MSKKKELEKVLEEKFLTPIKFSYEIERIVLQEKMNYIDAILYYCEKENIDVESISKLMTKPLKEKLKVDATRLNFMKARGGSKARLPLWTWKNEKQNQKRNYDTLWGLYYLPCYEEALYWRKVWLL